MNLEPDVWQNVVGIETQIQASIAISLKRIADALTLSVEGDKQSYSIAELVDKLAYKESKND